MNISKRESTVHTRGNNEKRAQERRCSKESKRKKLQKIGMKNFKKI
jgi:hypothetical protein